MSSDQPVLMYLLHGGSEPHWLEAELSLVSLLHQRSSEPLRVVLATDEPARAASWPVEVFPLTAESLADWMGPRRYLHRAKNRAQHAVMQAFPRSPVALVDVDTIFLRDAARLFLRIGPRRSVMHADEGRVEVSHPDVWVKVRGVEGITPDTRMLNSGVVGLDPSDRPLLDAALEQLDELHAASGWFGVEQLALGEVLRQRTRVALADDVVLHYWDHARFFVRARARAFLAALASASWEERARRFARFDLSRPRLSRRAMWGMALYRRARGWSRAFAFLVVTARAAERDPALREAWLAWAEAQLRTLRDGARIDPRWLRDPVARAALAPLGLDAPGSRAARVEGWG